MTHAFRLNDASFKTRENSPPTKELVVSALLSSPPPLQRFLHRCQLSLGQVLTGTFRPRSSGMPCASITAGTTRTIDRRSAHALSTSCGATTTGAPGTCRTTSLADRGKARGTLRTTATGAGCRWTPPSNATTARSSLRATAPLVTGLSPHSYSSRIAAGSGRAGARGRTLRGRVACGKSSTRETK